MQNGIYDLILFLKFVILKFFKYIFFKVERRLGNSKRSLAVSLLLQFCLELSLMSPHIFYFLQFLVSKLLRGGRNGKPKQRSALLTRAMVALRRWGALTTSARVPIVVNLPEWAARSVLLHVGVQLICSWDLLQSNVQIEMFRTCQSGQQGQFCFKLKFNCSWNLLKSNV